MDHYILAAFECDAGIFKERLIALYSTAIDVTENPVRVSRQMAGCHFLGEPRYVLFRYPDGRAAEEFLAAITREVQRLEEVKKARMIAPVG